MGHNVKAAGEIHIQQAACEAEACVIAAAPRLRKFCRRTNVKFSILPKIGRSQPCIRNWEWMNTMVSYPTPKILEIQIISWQLTLQGKRGI
jgi:hypothetical protein